MISTFILSEYFVACKHQNWPLSQVTNNPLTHKISAPNKHFHLSHTLPKDMFAQSNNTMACSLPTHGASLSGNLDLASVWHPGGDHESVLFSRSFFGQPEETK